MRPRHYEDPRELAEVTEDDLDRLAYEGISIPGTTMDHGVIVGSPSDWD